MEVTVKNEIKLLSTDEEILSAYEVMKELRPHLAKDEFVDRVRSQEKLGYCLLGLLVEGTVEAVAGFRLNECLSYGKHIYIDDLVTSSTVRSSGHGKQLMHWIENFGAENNCGELHLDSGVQRFDTHRFYFRERMSIVFYHFSKPIKK